MKTMKELLREKRNQIASKNSNFRPVTLPPGKSLIRIMPSWRPAADGEAQAFWANFGQHWIKTEKGGKPQAVFVCPDATYDKPCDVCSMVKAGKASFEERGDTENAELIGESGAAQKFLINAQVISGPDKDSVTIVSIGSTLFGQILDIMTEYDEEGINILDPKTGIDIIVNRTGSGFDTKYTAQASPKGPRAISPSLVDKTNNLDEIIAVEFARGGETKALSKLGGVLGLSGESFAASAPALTYKEDAIESEAEGGYAEYEEVDEAAMEEELELDEILEEEAAKIAPAPVAAKAASATVKAAAAKATAKAAPAAAKAAPAPARAKSTPAVEDDFDSLLAELDDMAI